MYRIEKLKDDARILEEMVKKNSPTILTTLGVVSEIGAIIMTVKATKKATDIINEEKIKSDKMIDKVKEVWKCYVPAGLLAGLSIGCMIGSNSINSHRYLALLGAYKLSEGQIKDYKNKVIELIEPEKEKGEIIKNKDETKIMVANENNDILCKDAISGRYFKGSVNKINMAICKANIEFASSNYISLNFIYELLGLDEIEIGDNFGWSCGNMMKNAIEVHYDSEITKDMQPCFVVHFSPEPKFML